MEIETPELDSADAEACAAFVADLPDTLAEQSRVDSTPEDAPGAAYGDPPIVVTCGVDEPEDYAPGAPCQIADGVRWYVPVDQFGNEPRDLTITAALDRPRVEVSVPADYWPEGGAAVMAALAPLVQQHLRPLPGDCV